MGRYSSGQSKLTSNNQNMQSSLSSKVNELYDKMMSNSTKVSVDDQNKHIEGSKNYNPNKSKFYGSIEKAQKLIKDFKGKGKRINENKERVDFGEIIGEYVSSSGKRMPTTIGIIHTSRKKGSHIVPARPKEE